MKTYSEQIELEIGRSTFKAEVEFSYTPEEKAKTFGLPEDCFPGWPEEFEINVVSIDDQPLPQALVEALEHEVIEAIKSKRHEAA